ncbi:cytochrome c oxidase subunit II [Metabacillus sp. GX 13764]|uniref:cytochrome c oxidase subunit II n=1 Tax=Metabacillus kandeliae TaxID=2900151 RepID=UPI001E3AC2FF|nr:cytochrome c oxidase subunit II [Metabacillus kandeliae]MCD7033932.1 cytochrome c oxidase subunit II [Metabacillus kandeliae]
MEKWLTKWRLLPLMLLMAFFMTGCGEPYLSTLRPAGEVADNEYNIMILSTIIMVVVVAVVTVIFIYVIIKFRRRKNEGDAVPKQVEGNHKLEILWTVIPILLLLILAVPVVASTFDLANVKQMESDKRKPEDALVVNVRANLYWWEFEYPDYKIITSQELVVPTDEKVYFKVKAADVKHSFWIPAAGGKVDANPENDNKFWLEFDSKRVKDAGEYLYGKCAELCGPSHALMDFKVKAVPRSEFDAWTKKMKDAKPVAQGDQEKQGEALFKQKGCIACHAVQPSDSRPEAARNAPNLGNFGNRTRVAGILDHSEENTEKWIKDPEYYKPGNKMSGSGKYPKLTDEEAKALAHYVMSLKVE